MMVQRELLVATLRARLLRVVQMEEPVVPVAMEAMRERTASRERKPQRARRPEQAEDLVVVVLA